ncbi:molybdate ABC transporter substrate-binding protein [Desulfosporosinus sp. FKA]|uniref:molybdate ABC transporter substrate-binding protein n=1 Tax=Desulfosporosinus sp. FKA TaxID=1969834 RepID=UPI000B49F31A|nr:molybdate ABC transporter substrate-binding protein [Desulfosporosinus sp. FKA]
MFKSMRRNLSLIVLPLISLFLLTACAVPGQNTTQPVQQPTSSVSLTTPKLRISAAADLALAFKEIAAQFEKETGIPTEITFSSTGTAALQIENGAPYDVFAAADESYLNKLSKEGFILAATQQLYAQGRIGIATLKGNNIEIKELKDLADNPKVKKIAIADPSHAPYGKAAKQAFEHQNLWDKVQSKMVYGQNIQDTLAILKSGNVDAAIISLSIYKPDEVNFTMIDPSWYEPLNQAMAILKTTKQEENARKFVAYVNGEKGRVVMKKYGFLLPDEIAKK